MNTDAAVAVVDLVLRYGFVDRMDEANAELERLGWIPEPIDGDGSCLDTKWQYPSSDYMWRVYSGLAGAEFSVGLMVNTDLDSKAIALADSIRSVVEHWASSNEARHTREGASELWTDDVRMIELQVLPGSPAGPGKAIPPALQLVVSNEEKP
ncbi:hypothetical protein CH251_07210 [Rhodococcus sp. 06-462-5]|uniref:hypothetical protein n=1 Tax=unclassified Rhodococcus (in: high G+C Gram-positive bacteria) TaxID=192944 RepID=UPI000B9BD1F2|nr:MULTISPECIES: hypothetical protein [unclassified Rhodococcus (in: high G+C Gram-positive bacteria)]OZC76649.1 hypothetical protein CH251_07210 [Rhodococcus sp. 06-462-5]OZE64706.1 hypothetical protein CH270_16950 [Rhodococcus sp. 02-925g]